MVDRIQFLQSQPKRNEDQKPFWFLRFVRLLDIIVLFCKSQLDLIFVDDTILGEEKPER
jgi:hypothetical protein